MEQQRKRARKDRMSIAEQIGINDRGDEKQELDDGKDANWMKEVGNPPNVMSSGHQKMDGTSSVEGKISTLRWQVPKNGISKLL